MRRTICSALVLLFLAPFLAVVALVAPASADTYGQGVRVTWSGSWTDNVSSCFADAYYDLGPVYMQVLVPQVGCSEGVGGFLLDEGASTISLSFKGIGDQGACSYETGAFPFKTTSAAATTGLFTTGCKVTQACIHVKEVQHAMFDGSFDGCQTVDFGALPQAATPAPPGGCPYFHLPSKPWISTGATSPSVHFSAAGDQLNDPSGSPYGVTVRWFEVYRMPDATVKSSAYQSLVPTGSTGGSAEPGGRTAAYTNAQATFIGMQAYGPSGPSSNYPDASQAVVYDGTTNRYAVLGMTDSSKCSFYFGQKIGTSGTSPSTPAGTLDNTAPSAGTGSTTAPTTSAPPAAGASCNFSVTDPSTWASGGICALVGLMGRSLGLLSSIISGVAAVPAAILNGLGNIFQGLFVPSSGKLSGFTSAVQSSLSGSSAGTWWDALTGAVGSTASVNVSGSGGSLARVVTTDASTTVPPALAVPAQVQPGGITPTGDGSTMLIPGVTAGGGCDGPAVTVPQVMVKAGLSSPWYPLSACSGQAASVAGVCRKVSAMFLAFFGLLKCIELIGNGLGFAKNIRIMDSHDWSSPSSGRLT